MNEFWLAKMYETVGQRAVPPLTLQSLQAQRPCCLFCQMQFSWWQKQRHECKYKWSCSWSKQTYRAKSGIILHTKVVISWWQKQRQEWQLRGILEMFFLSNRTCGIQSGKTRGHCKACLYKTFQNQANTSRNSKCLRSSESTDFTF